jgi:hypothetical protein
LSQSRSISSQSLTLANPFLVDRYNDVFGSPVSLALGAGWVTEMVARLTHTPVTVHDSTTNATLHNPVQFPLNDALYVDVTHEVSDLESTLESSI